MTIHPTSKDGDAAITVSNCVVAYKETRIPLIAGEMQYWRITREYWEPVIRRAKEMGLRVISSNVPWVYHETAEGVYDFHGTTTPQRDLAGFIDLLKQHEIYFIMRPGPYIYGSMPNGGVPDRAAKLDRLAPEFLAMARHYIHAIAEIIRPRQITCGGNIILCAADNEPYPPIESFGTESGCFEQDGLFKDWLRAKYGNDIARINARWNSRLADFSEACVYFHEICVDCTRPMAGRLLSDPAVFPRYADTHEFIGWYGAKIVAEAKGWLREAGVEIPVYANGWSPTYQDFHQFCGASDLAGVDLYPTPFFAGEGHVADDWFYNLDIVKLQEADVTNGNVWSAEYQGGMYPPELGYLPAQHFRYANRVFMANGLKAWDWYLMTTRGNWTGNPIMEFGERNYSFNAVAGQNRLADRIEPWHCTAVNDLSLFCYKPHRVIDPGDFSTCFNLLQDEDLSFDYYNPQSKERPTTNVLLYTGGDWIDEEAEAKLLAFVEGGGTLIAFNRYPRWRTDMRTPTGFGFVDPVGARPVALPVEVTLGAETCTVQEGGHLGFKVNFFFFNEVPGRAITARIGVKAKEIVGGLVMGGVKAREFKIGYVLNRGKGRIIHLGSNPSRSLIAGTLRELGIVPACSSQTARVLTAIHRHVSGRLVLYVINRNEVQQLCRIRIDPERNQLATDARWQVSDPDGGETLTLSTGELQSLLVNVAAQDVAIRIIEPA